MRSIPYIWTDGQTDRQQWNLFVAGSAPLDASSVSQGKKTTLLIKMEANLKQERNTENKARCQNKPWLVQDVKCILPKGKISN